MLKNKIITNNKTIKELSVVVNAFCVFALGAMMNIERKSTSWDTSTATMIAGHYQMGNENIMSIDPIIKNIITLHVNWQKK